MPKYTFNPDLVVPPEGEPGDVPARPTYTVDGVEITYEELLQRQLEPLARVTESKMGLEPGAISATDDFRALLKDPVALEALLAEAVEQVRGPLHYDGDIALAVMGQIVGPDRQGEALVPVEATYSLETNWTEVWYRVAVEADVEAHVAAVGRSAA